jgi:conjugative relaxase-like TrwC/TraI family protein
MRVMSAGAGYAYLLRSVATGDGNRSMTDSLTRYYTESGTPPGFWIGGGLPGLDAESISTGAEVTEKHLRLLIGEGRHPETGAPLGSAYRVYANAEERAKRRIENLPAASTGAQREAEADKIRTEENARTTRRPVAGYDYTFSVPKSVSVWWAVADGGTQALIARAHHDTIAEVLDLMERDVVATRTGHDGVAQVDVRGVVATAYDHYDSRANDPQLHTHVVIANRVQAAHDGRWRAIDGRPMHAWTVALSEHYNNLLLDRLARDFAITWEARDRGPRRAQAWEITAVPEELLTEFSSRSHQIDAAADALIAAYTREHGSAPSKRTIIRLRAEATLTTRPDKTIHPLADLTNAWRQRASTVLGSDATAWARTVPRPSPDRPLRADDIPLATIDEIAARVLEAVGQARSTWRRANLHAEASRQLRAIRFATATDREAVVGLITDRAQHDSIRLTPPELATSPPEFQRDDGTSTFRVKHGTLYTSGELLAAEDRLLDLSHTTTGPTVPAELVVQITQRTDRKGRRLSPDQVGAVTLIAGSGRTLDVLIGPAGTGKTTALASLRRAWELAHGKGSVVGLAPSANAAHVLAADLGIPTENTAKWLHEHNRGGWRLHRGQLMIVDEASLSGTFALDRLAQHAHTAGAKLLLTGDWAQLDAIDAGGALGMIARDLDHAPELHQVRRLTHDWEKTASLQLRIGDTAALTAYQEHGRIVPGDYETLIDDAYRAWKTDITGGQASILVAETSEAVTTLNIRARTDLIRDGRIDATTAVQLGDGTAASPGDVVVTRENNRRLATSRGRWVRNGDRWHVIAAHPDGSVTVRREDARTGGAIRLPADYAAAHLELGYALTARRAQGMTVDTAHVIVHSNEMSREAFYVAMTRGRESNTAWVAVDQFALEEHQRNPDLSEDPEHAVWQVLSGVLAHEAAERSAHEQLTIEHEKWSSIGQLAAEYETLADVIHQDRWIGLLAAAGLSPNQVDAIAGSGAYGPLTAELRRADAEHYDLDTLLPELVAARALDDADDLAAVLHHRLTAATAQPGLRSPQLIAGLLYEARNPDIDPDLRHALDERRDLIEQRAFTLVANAVADNSPWLLPLGPPPSAGRPRDDWFRQARIVAAYRDRYRIIDPRDTLGPIPDDRNQARDAVRAHAAALHARRLSTPTRHTPAPGAAPELPNPVL